MENYTRPELDADNKDLSIMVPLAWQAQAQANKPERIFKYGTALARVSNSDDNAKIEILTSKILRFENSKAVDWQSQHGKRREPAYPPQPIVEGMLATPLNEIPLSYLEGITSCPVFSEYGNLEDENGYLKESHRYYTGRPLKNLPEKITEKEIKESKEWILKPYKDFDFETEADRDNAIALMFTPFIKPMLGETACIPGGLCSAPVHGSGKGLISKVILTPAYGRNYKLTPLPENEEEIKKKITSLICEGCPAVMFDNINKAVDSASLAALFTAKIWSDRILGRSEMVTLPNDLLVILTGNNVALSGEMSRRLIRIRLAPRTDRPWLRDGFSIENLSEWIEDYRIVLQKSIVTIIKGWIEAGQPIPKDYKPFGSFEAWSKIMSGIMNFAGFNNFLGNALEFFNEADTEGAAWRSLCSAWWDEHKDQPVKAADLFDIAKDIEGMPFYSKSEEGNRRSFGKQLLKQKDRVFDCFQIKTSGTYKGRTLWKLINDNPVHVVQVVHVLQPEKFENEIYTGLELVPHVPLVPNESIPDWDELKPISELEV